ncbi:MAG: site-specific DNA-methyltransferase [Alphaproteobacteria bacterium]|nr:site-specific DNA-methyltransferase [Alphaproteobacteria bacterium]
MSCIDQVINKIIKGDSIDVLKSFEDNCIDVIFADPPYFMQSTDKVLQRADGTGEFRGCDDDWDKYKDYAEYDAFCMSWLRECKRILKKNGSIWVIGSFQNIYRIGYIMQNMGFWILNDIVWSKTNPTPNMSGTRFCNAHETLLWCSKYKNSKFTFNYKTMKTLNGGKQDKSVWTLGICQGSERLKDGNGNKLHSTQKPEDLLSKIILSSTKPNDIILDPFFGTGTTGAIAKKYGRRFVGIERDDNYIAGAEKRIKQQQEHLDMFSNLDFEVKPPRISMSSLISLNKLYIGQELLDKAGNVIGVLTDNGYVNDGEESLSIHKSSAKVLKLSNNNGWNFFYISRDGKLVSINDLRYETAKEKHND